MGHPPGGGDLGRFHPVQFIVSKRLGSGRVHVVLDGLLGAAMNCPTFAKTANVGHPAGGKWATRAHSSRQFARLNSGNLIEVNQVRGLLVVFLVL